MKSIHLTLFLFIVLCSAASAQVQAIAKTTNGTLLAASENRLMEIDAGNSVKEVKYEGLHGNTTALASGKNGEVWIATDQALFRCEKRECQNSKLDITEITALTVDDHNQLWIGTRNGLIKKDSAGAMSSPVKIYNVEALAHDTKGGLWIASGFEVILYKDGKQNTFSLPPPPPNVRMRPPVTSILATRSGEIWVGTRQGILVLENQKFRKNFPDLEVLALMEDQQGRVWAGTSEGFKKLVNDQWIDVPLGK